jgi:hypothetical protein
MNPAQAQYRAGTVSGIAQTCGLVFAPVAGLILDRLNRVFGTVSLLFHAYLLLCLHFALLLLSLALIKYLRRIRVACCRSRVWLHSSVLLLERAKLAYHLRSRTNWLR